MMNPDGIVQNTDLVALVERAGTQMRPINGEWRGCCPLHKGDNKTAFAVYTDAGKLHWKCFTHDCGQGDAIDFVMKWRGCDWKTAYKFLGGDDRTDPAEVQRYAAERAERVARELEQTISQAQKVLAELREAQSWVKYHDNLDTVPDARQLWTARGVPDAYQDIWELGYCEHMTVSCSAGQWTTPTLSIPIKSPSGELLNIRHRLLNPPTPNDKYRPERPGLHAHPFICDTDKGYELEHVLIVEGEVKSMVAYICMDNPKLQVIGIPGKSWKGDLAEQLKGHKVRVCLDPDGSREAAILADELGGKAIYLPDKIDDLIIRGLLDKPQLKNILVNAR